MKKNIYLFQVPLIFNYSFATQDIPTLTSLCGEALILKYGIDDKSKPQFNQLITDQEVKKEAFDFTGKTIQGPDKGYDDRFAGLYLKHFNFTNTTLINLSLKHARLQDAIFNNTTFKNVDLSDTDLTDVKFIKCKFIDCNLKRTNLTSTSLKGSKFKRVKLHQATLYPDFKFDKHYSDPGLLRLYAQLIQKREQEKAQALKKIFAVRKLKFRELSDKYTKRQS